MFKVELNMFCYELDLNTQLLDMPDAHRYLI